MNIKKFNKNDYINLLFNIISGLMYGFVIVNFSEAGHVYPGGFAGISRILSDILVDYCNINIPFAFIYFPLNLVSFLFVYKKIGKKFAFFSLVQVLTASLSSSISPYIFNLDEQIIICVFGGVLNGIAITLALEHNGSSGGSDFFGVYFSNKFNKSIFNYVLGFNCIILIIAGLIYGWQITCYSIIYQYASTVIINTYHKRYSHLSLFIITKMPDEVSANIFKNTRHGITKLNGEGEFKHEDTNMLFMTINTYEKNTVIKSIKDIDPKAFITILDSKQIVGNYYQKPLD